jgi:hypothetical protein
MEQRHMITRIIDALMILWQHLDILTEDWR